MTQEEKIIDKIMKLLELANHPKTPPAEAESAFGMAQALMAKWAIDDIALQSRAGATKSTDELVNHKVTISSTYFVPRMRLWSAVADANGLKCVYMQPRTGQQGCVWLTGWKSDLDRALLLGAQLDLYMGHAASNAVNTDPYLKPYYFKRSFMEGFAQRIRVRLIEARRTAVDEAVKADTENKLLPALASRSNEVDAYFRQQHPSLKSGRAGRNQRQSWDGVRAGRAAADRADIGQRAAGRGNRGQLGS